MSKVSQSIIVIFLMICGAGIAGAEDRDSWISLHSYSFDVYGPSPVIPDHLRTISSDKSSEGYYLVKLPGPIQSANFQALSDRALKIYAYIPYYAYLVKLKNDHKRSLLAETGAIWLGEYHPAYKISRDIAAVTEKSDKDLYIVMVQIFPDADLAALEKQILALGVPRLEGSAANPYFSRIRLLLAPDEVVMLREQIALLRDVFWIDIEPRKALLNDTTIWVGQSGVDGGQATPAFDHGLYGQNQIIAALDTGLDADMCYFYDTTLAELPPQNCNGATVVDMNQRKVIAVDFLWDDECADLVIDDDEWDTQDHGTHVGGIMTGDNYANLLIHDSGDGMAPGAKIVFQDGGYETNDCADCPGIGCPVVDLNPIFQQPYDQGARIHSNSWGDNENASVQNNYTTASEDVDQFMWNNPDFLLFFAAGNSGPSVGSVGSPSTAKNCVSVGATARGSSAESLASFTSYGPTDDNRIKPEVTIPGSGIYSANNDMNASTMNCTTQSMSGTSMACPAAAGLTALIRQYYTEGWYPSGLETPADAFTPTAALLKATLVNSAQEMTGVSASIPANSQGWGRILLDNVLYWDGETSKLWLTEDPGFSTGSSASRVFSQQVVSNSVPFKVTLNWTDYPSTPAASPHLNNDLDLIVEGPGGTTYLGNVFTNGESTTGGSADHLNTLEQVLLLVPTTGVYVITVQAYNIPNGPQPFALVITGDISASSEGLIYLDRFTYNCDDTITITLLDGDIVGNGSQNVIAWSDSEGSASSPAETITLTESPADSGQFIGNVNTSLNTTSGDGAIGVVHGDNITVRYIDADYGGTPNVNVDVTATADCQAPIISNVQVSNITTDSAEITWSTNENADSFVYYGTTPPTWSDESSGVMVTGHSITIAGLSDCTLYYFWVESADGAGNTASDDNSGSYYAFTTQMAVNMFYDDMESGPSNWTAASPWALSTEAYHSSNHAWSDSPGGNYGNNLNVSLTSIPFDLSSTTEANLTFWHTYALESGWDYGYLEISTNGSTWSQLAVFNGTQTEWTESSYDLTTYVGHSNVQIRFRLDSDGYQTMDGWHIDDVSIGYAAPCVPLAEYDSHIFTDDCPAGGAGDADGILDAGETIVFQIDIANIGTGDLTGVWAELSTSTTGVTVTDAQADYNDILEGTSGTSLSPHFTVYLAETIACGTTLDFSLTIHTNEGDFTGGSFSETVGVVVPGDFTLVDEDFESSWGTYGDNPPVGWTIEDYGDEGTPTWNANDWYRYSKGGAYSYIARVYYSPLENQDEWLITPAFTIPAGATSVNLEYDHYFRVYSTGEYGYVDFRSTQNPSWTNLVTYSSTTSDMGHATISLLAYAGNTNCQVRFRYESYNGWNWDLDNVLVSGVQAGACNMNVCTGGCSMTVAVTPNGTTTVCTGNAIMFTATPTGGTSPYSYQWTEDGSDISGATNDTLTRNYGSAQSHSYNCKVSDAGACVDITDGTASTGTWELTPGAPVISSVTDLDACALTGIAITFTAGSGASSHNLWVDGSQAATGITSPYTYVPGDTSSHSYVVRAINGGCYADSSAVAGTDVNDGVVTVPVITDIIDPDPATYSGLVITYTAGSPYTSHDLWMDGSLLVTGFNSGDMTPPGDGNSHDYVIRAWNNTCYADSVAVPGRDNPSDVPPEITPLDWSGTEAITWTEEATATSGYVLYRGVLANLANLLTTDTDFCIRWTGSSSSDTSATGLTETATVGDCYYFLVVGVNGNGNGTAGYATAGERQVNDTGVCP